MDAGVSIQRSRKSNSFYLEKEEEIAPALITHAAPSNPSSRCSQFIKE